MAEYTKTMNAFLTTLVNKIAFQEVLTKSFENPIAEFKKGAMPLGYTGEFVHVNPAELKDYTLPEAPNYTDPFTAEKPVVFADYLSVNEDKIASRLLNEDYIADAFSTYDKFYEMTQQIVSSLYSGNNIYELGLMLATTLTGFADDSRTVETIELPTDEASAQAAILAIKDMSANMSMPSSDYVAADYAEAGAISWVAPENQRIIMTNALKNRLEVYARAYAYNVGNLDFLPRVTAVNSIGQIEGKELHCIIMDVAALQIRDKIFRVDSIYNPADGSLNYWLRRRTMAGFVGFANAGAFAKLTPRPALVRLRKPRKELSPHRRCVNC